MSQQYISAIVILVVSILGAFGIHVANDAITGIIVGGLALWVAIRRYKQGDIKVSGVRL